MVGHSLHKTVSTMKILIAIHGSHSQPEQMQAQRETWLRDLGGADYKFFLGQPFIEQPEPRTYAICPEDIDDIVTGNYPDGPRLKGIHRTWHLNRKTEALAKYALENGYDFVFKCDDDTYVRTDLLLESGFEEHDYVGFTDTHYTRELGWYFWAQGGAGYWLSRKAMQIVAQNGLHVIPAEDFAVGNILAANGIHPDHEQRYNPNVTAAQLESPESLDLYITLHKVNPEQMRRLHGSRPKRQPPAPTVPAILMLSPEQDKPC